MPILTTNIGSCSQWQKVCFSQFQGENFQFKEPKTITIFRHLNCTVTSSLHHTPMFNHTNLVPIHPLATATSCTPESIMPTCTLMPSGSVPPLLRGGRGGIKKRHVLMDQYNLSVIQGPIVPILILDPLVAFDKKLFKVFPKYTQ